MQGQLELTELVNMTVAESAEYEPCGSVNHFYVCGDARAFIVGQWTLAGWYER